MPARCVAELMNPNVVSARPGMTVGEVGELLASRGISGAPVVDDAGRILGVVSQSDLVRYTNQRKTMGESGRFFSDVEEYRELANLPRGALDTPIEEVMTQRVYTVTRDSSVAVSANIMRERKIHRLLVTDGGVLVGVVTSLDLLRIVEESC